MNHKLLRYRVRKESVADATRLVEELVDLVGRREGGVAFYRAMHDALDPTRFTHVAAFRTKAAEENHHKASWTKDFLAKVAPLCTEPPAYADVTVIGERS